MGYASFLILAGVLIWFWRRIVALEGEVARLRGHPGFTDGVVDFAPAVAAPRIPSPEPAPAPVVEPGPPADYAEPAQRRFDFEDLFGRMLPIWAGGVTLAVAGFFLVRWSIERGLLTPSVRVLLAGLFGVVLLAGAEAAYRWRERVADPRVAQALAGAGLATLYAAFYLAGSTYGLIAPALAFVGLAAVTAGAIGLSFRFGLPSAVLGLVGGFAAPALVGAEQANLPLLTLYLGLVVGGLAFTGRRQGRGWLGLAALAGGLVWGGLLVSQGPGSGPDIAVLGAYLVLLGAIVPALAGGALEANRWLRAGATGLAALQLAVLVATGGFGALAWGLYLLLGAALAGFGWRDPAMREGGSVAAIVGVLLLWFWPAPDPRGFALVAAGLALVFAGPPLAALARGSGRMLDLAQVSGMALGLAAALYVHFVQVLPAAPELLHALALAACAALAAAGARFGRGVHGWRDVAEATAVLLAMAALAQLMPADTLAWMAAALAAAVAWRAKALTGALAAAVALALAWGIAPAVHWLAAGAEALVGTPMVVGSLPTARDVVLHLLPGAAAALAWRVLSPPGGGRNRALEATTLVVAVIAVHALFRHGFAAIAGTDFGQTGVVERAVWEALLAAAGALALGRGQRRIGAIIAGAALAHFAWFSLALHNPLWSGQAVGAWPVMNGLLAMYGAAFVALWLAGKLLRGAPQWLRWVHHGAVVLVAAFFAVSELRQVFAGSLLIGAPVGQTEDLLRSLVGIVLAAGFLLVGHTQRRAQLADRQPRADGRRGAQGVPDRRRGAAGAGAGRLVHGAGFQPHRHRLVLQPPAPRCAAPSRPGSRLTGSPVQLPVTPQAVSVGGEFGRSFRDDSFPRERSGWCGAAVRRHARARRCPADRRDRRALDFGCAGSGPARRSG